MNNKIEIYILTIIMGQTDTVNRTFVSITLQPGMRYNPFKTLSKFEMA
jgi:hypothetical protein